MQLTNDPEIRFTVVNNGNFLFVSSTTTPTAVTYTHVTSRYDFSTGDLALFINGQPVDTTSVGQLPALTSQQWRIGEDTNPGSPKEFLDGTVDDARIYQAALSDSQINQIFQNTKP